MDDLVHFPYGARLAEEDVKTAAILFVGSREHGHIDQSLRNLMVKTNA
jgi:hypothetical protein